VAILVDEAIWNWEGRRWAHLVSDEHYGELHDFVAALGLRRLSFQGDHYDVETITRRRAVAMGAMPIPSRDLVRRLREAGLRYRGSASWERSELQVLPTTEMVVDFVSSFASHHPDLSNLLQVIETNEELVTSGPVRILRRSFELAIVVETIEGPVDLVADNRHRGIGQ
jgi:hypothetical protein